MILWMWLIKVKILKDEVVVYIRFVRFAWRMQNKNKNIVVGECDSQ